MLCCFTTVLGGSYYFFFIYLAESSQELVHSPVYLTVKAGSWEFVLDTASRLQESNCLIRLCYFPQSVLKGSRNSKWSLVSNPDLQMWHTGILTSLSLNACSEFLIYSNFMLQQFLLRLNHKGKPRSMCNINVFTIKPNTWNFIHRFGEFMVHPRISWGHY